MSEEHLINVKKITRLKIEPDELLVVRIPKEKCSKEIVDGIVATFKSLRFGRVLVDSIGCEFTALKKEEIERNI